MAYGEDTDELMQRIANIQDHKLDVSYLKITSLPPLPKDLVWLDCSYTDIETLPELPETLLFLECDGTKLKMLPPLPVGLVDLTCKDTEIPQLCLDADYYYDEVYKDMVFADESMSDYIQRIREWIDQPSPVETTTIINTDDLSNKYEIDYSISHGPDTDILFNRIENAKFKILDIAGLDITSIPPLPDSITVLECNRTNITEIKNLPPNLVSLDCSHTPIKTLPPLPNTLTRLYCKGTTLPQIEKEVYVSYNSTSSVIKDFDKVMKEYIKNIRMWLSNSMENSY